MREYGGQVEGRSEISRERGCLFFDNAAPVYVAGISGEKPAVSSSHDGIKINPSNRDYLRTRELSMRGLMMNDATLESRFHRTKKYIYSYRRIGRGRLENVEI